ncbi:MAG: 3-hydroxyacyl-CoA dehydrogenase NAD-binding domain-containing protein, partial [Pseudomonadota bacterium]|nr:3-hydroxyacyl-CoA dehydrogenase NAD-binding domain-containing protein [Pseudomonadota bacterium]
MTTPKFDDITTLGVIGAGTIGASWAAYFLARGYQVIVWDPAAGWANRLDDMIATAWPQLEELGVVVAGAAPRPVRAASPEEVVAGATVIQESALENMAVKRALYAQMDAVMTPDHVILSSTSGLIMSEMQAGLSHAARFVLGHPFNPPHLIPLVEIIGNDRTSPDAVTAAERFYAEVGKTTIRVNKEVPGHVANRLQAALWREALYLVREGVASVEDVDRAVWAGPGLRWGAMGPHMLFNLGAGEG